MKITEIPAKPPEKKTLRVAAYARVSADKDAAFHSLEAQNRYYEAYAAMHRDWELVGIYSDNGISGTIINRPEFQRMLEDCRAGKIDLVVTKSITRFARNTIILLETIRELKTLGIDCYFEKENMHSNSPDGELLLTLLAMYAEEEARSASENQKWRIRKKFEQGEPWGGNMLGYRLVDGKMVIIPDEAEIVRQIFQDYLSGMGKPKIAKKLESQHIAPPASEHWNTSTIGKILLNEKYTGNMLLQKTYRKDHRDKKIYINHGERRMFIVENSHDAIIDQETFDAVQAKISENVKMPKHKTEPRLFSGLIHCDICNHSYMRHYSNKGKYKKATWICSTLNTLGKSVCSSRQIPEDILIAKTKKVLGLEEVTREALLDNITIIHVPDRNHLVYELKNGTSMEVAWENASRKHSWTPEMRQAARERELKRNAERRKNGEKM